MNTSTAQPEDQVDHGTPSFVVRICQGRTCLGTGFVVGRRLVVTCAHIFRAADGYEDLGVVMTCGQELASGERTRVVQVQSIKSREAPDRSRHASDKDVAVVITAESVDVNPVALQRGVSEDHLLAWNERLLAYGFRSPDGEPQRASQLAIRGRPWTQAPHSAVHNGTLDTCVLPGGSGSPVLVDLGAGGLAVVGMIYQSGTAGTLFYGSDAVIEELEQLAVAAFVRPAGEAPNAAPSGDFSEGNGQRPGALGSGAVRRALPFAMAATWQVVAALLALLVVGVVILERYLEGSEGTPRVQRREAQTGAQQAVEGKSTTTSISANASGGSIAVAAEQTGNVVIGNQEKTDADSSVLLRP